MTSTIDPIASGSTDDIPRRLAANDYAYRRLRKRMERLRRTGDPRLLPFIERVADFAWRSHPGRLTDGALENVLIEIGRDMPVDAGSASNTEVTTRPPSRTLHVVSQVYPTGGHSRVLSKWIERDHSSRSTVVFTRQRGDIPSFLSHSIRLCEASTIRLNPDDHIIDRARHLRASSRNFDRIILHNHPDDAVPVIAYATHGGPPVAMFNHAHFWFSLGSGISDIIINTMPYFTKLTQDYRYPEKTDRLDGPFGLDLLYWDDIDKYSAKVEIGLAGDRPVVMSIGGEPYFAALGGRDFFATLAKLLGSHPDLQVLLVGVSKKSTIVPDHIRSDNRVHFIGPVSDPKPYYRAADICLESFPMPSLGALTEAVAYGQAFPVPAYGAGESPLHVNQQRIAAITSRPRTEEEYLRRVAELLENKVDTFQRAGELRATLIRDDIGFGDQFAALYERIDRLEHKPRLLPTTSCRVTPETLALASVTNPTEASRAISHLPPASAVIAHLGAIAQGYETPQEAASSMAKRLHAAAMRHLPWMSGVDGVSAS